MTFRNIQMRGVYELTESQREILNHRFGYSDQYEKVTSKEIAEKLRLTREAVHAKKNTLERKINDEIIWKHFGNRDIFYLIYWNKENK
jgi:DNA-directed RNA polymerase sigma subunit (sigma70/sigma32)